MLEIQNLFKSFSGTEVLKDININIEKGDILCLLGPNGSGKTTIINCVLSLLMPDRGNIRLNNNTNLQTGRQKTGVIMEEDGFYRDLSVEKNLKIACLIKGVDFSVIPGLLEKISLTEHRKKLVKKLSQGMRKRLSIASSLVGNPELLIWDEPYNGLDPTGFQFMRKLIADLNQNTGKTIVISTHLLNEVERTATKIGLIYKGEIKEVLTLEAVRTRFGTVENFYFNYVKENI